LKTSLLAALTVAFTTALAAPAMAHENPQNFPMPAATFEKHVDARLERAKARMESYIAQQNLPEAEAQQIRARFNTVAGEVEAEVGRAVADGVVTLEEAKAVRAVARQLPFHRQHRPQGDT
jgi:hypothetical protein